MLNPVSPKAESSPTTREGGERKRAEATKAPIENENVSESGQRQQDSHGSAVAYIIDGPADRENLP